MHFHKDQKIQWHKQIPKNWATTKIKNQCQIIPSNVDKKSYDYEITVNLCNYTDVYYTDFIDNSIKFMIGTANEHEIEKFQLLKGDVIITKDSEDPSDIAVPAIVVETQPKLLCGYHLSILRPIHQNKYSGSFLFWALKDLSIVSQLHKEATGITRWAISNKHVKNCLLPIAPFDEQKRIAAYLDKTCASIDEAIELKRKQLDILDALRKSIIHKAVTQGLDVSVELTDSGVTWLGKIPAHWHVSQLKQISTLQTGITLGKKYSTDLIERPYLRVANVQDGYLDLKEVKTVFVPESEAKGSMLQQYDVLMTEGGDLDKLGRGHLWDDQIPNCIHQNHIFAIRCNTKKLLPEFLTYVTASSYGRAYFEATGKRTTNLASTNATKIRAFHLPLPSTTEQAAIIKSIRQKVNRLDNVQENLNTQITTLGNYRKSLIHECVTGKRRITEDDFAPV